MKRVALILLLLPALATAAPAKGLSEHDNATHNWAHIGGGAAAAVGARFFFAPIEKEHPYWAAAGYFAAAFGAQVVYKMIEGSLADPHFPERILVGGLGGGAIVTAARWELKF